MLCDLPCQYHLCKDVSCYVIGGTVRDRNLPHADYLSDKVVTNVDVFGSGSIVIICGKLECYLVITVDHCWFYEGREQLSFDAAKPHYLLCSMGHHHILCFSG